MMMDMAANATMVSVEAYLRMNDKPAFEYRDGELTRKHLPTSKHWLLQGRIVQIILNQGRCLAGPELHVRIRDGRFLVPDVAVQLRGQTQHPYPTEPIPLCVEILSPDDRFGEVVTKCEEYHAWGVPMTWIVDPETRVAWEYAKGGRVHEIPAGGSITADDIVIPVASIFEVLD